MSDSDSSASSFGFDEFAMFDSESSGSSSGNSDFDGNDAPTENTRQSNPLTAEGKKKWIAAMETYLMETLATSLDLSFISTEIKLGVEDARSIFRILLNSHVTELHLDGHDLSGVVEDLIQMLLATRISKLSINGCHLYHENILRLMAVLKDTQVTGLCILENGVIEFDENEGNLFISHLIESRLTHLAFDFGFSDPGRESDFSYPYVTRFIRVVPTTMITNLSLYQVHCSEDALSFLFSNLCYIPLTNLSLNAAGLKVKNVKELSLYLRDSKLVSLDLANNVIEDAGIDALSIGLIHSKITTLDISDTSLTGSNSLGLCLKDSQIHTLDVSHNTNISSYILLSFPGFLKYSSLVTLDISYSYLGDDQGQKLVKSLQFSKINKLNLGSNNLQLLTASAFADIVKDTEITDIDFSDNYFPSDGIVILGNCLKDSKLKHINLWKNQTSENVRTDPVAYSIFLEKSKESPLESINLDNIGLNADGAKTIANSLANTKFTHLNLRENKIGDGIVDLATQLKFTAITHLDLSLNMLDDAGAESIVKCLNETKITHLSLMNNKLGDTAARTIAEVLGKTRLIDLDLAHHGQTMTNCGVQTLIASVKGTNLLRLSFMNSISSIKLEALVQHVEDTFVTCLGQTSPFIASVLLKNKVAVHHFVTFFKRIAPESSSNRFRLDESICNANVDAFLEECLVFYKTVTEQPSAISVIVNDESFSFSWEEVVSLLREEFPRQFATFVINSLEATVTEHVVFLKRVEELGLSKIVEFLLLNRPALMIDEHEGILHPYVYKLLHKYKQPLYSSVEPEGKSKIMKYFSEHLELEGATEIINLLQNDKK